MEMDLWGRPAGLSPERISTPIQLGGNGLPSMQRREADLGGEFIIDSKPGAGTTIMMNLPMHAIGTETEAIQLGSDGKDQAV